MSYYEFKCYRVRWRDITFSSLGLQPTWRTLQCTNEEDAIRIAKSKYEQGFAVKVIREEHLLDYDF